MAEIVLDRVSKTYPDGVVAVFDADSGANLTRPAS